MLQEVSNLHRQLGDNDRGYADKIGRLDRENKTLTEEFRQSQEQLRISTSQTSKLTNEFNEVKNRIEQLTRENDVLKN